MKCKKCGSDNLYGLDGLDGELDDTVTQSVACGDCNHEWVNIYKLVEDE